MFVIYYVYIQQVPAEKMKNMIHTEEDLDINGKQKLGNLLNIFQQKSFKIVFMLFQKILGLHFMSNLIYMFHIDELSDIVPDSQPPIYKSDKSL